MPRETRKDLDRLSQAISTNLDYRKHLGDFNADAQTIVFTMTALHRAVLEIIAIRKDIDKLKRKPK